MQVEGMVELGVYIAGIVFAVGYTKSSLDEKIKRDAERDADLEKFKTKIENEISQWWIWKNEHLKDSNSVRFAYTERFGSLEGAIREKSARDEDIIRRLERMEDLLSQLIQGQRKEDK